MTTATIWLFDSRTLSAGSVAAGQAWLGPAERQRLAGFVRAGRRLQFIAGRALLRATLAPLLGVAPAAVALLERRGNAPRLDVPGRAAPCFSLSHSGPWIACAISADAPVGLDIECIDATRDVTALAAQVFDAAQQAVLASLAPAARMAAFYTMWCTAEAQYKLGAPAAHTSILDHPEIKIVLCSGALLAAAPALVPFDATSLA